MLVEYAAKWVWNMLGGSPGDVMFTLLIFVGVFAAVRSAQWLKFVHSLPPGPWGLPIVGYLPFLKGDIHLQFGELAKKYGSMFSARLGTQLVVVLSDYRAIRDTFRRDEFNARPHNEFMNILGGYGKLITQLLTRPSLTHSFSYSRSGIINSEGAMWKEQRRFLHDNLRSLGMTYLGAGKKIMETKIMVSVSFCD